jgi:hypothetical protein
MISGASGARFFIGGTAPTSTLVAFQALTWVEVGEVENLGEFGDESGAINFTGLKDGRTRTRKGPRDAGSMSVVVGDDMLDVGQAAMEAAEASPLDYNFKVVLNDAVTVGGSPSEHYYRGLVMSKRRNVGDASNIVRRTFAVKVNTDILSTDPD